MAMNACFDIVIDISNARHILHHVGMAPQTAILKNPRIFRIFHHNRLMEILKCKGDRVMKPGSSFFKIFRNKSVWKVAVDTYR